MRRFMLATGLMLAAPAAFAADMPAKAPVYKAPAYSTVTDPGFFGFASGAYLKNASDDTYLAGLTAPGNSGNGYGGKIYLGYRFANNVDIAFGLNGARLRDATQAGANHTQNSKFIAVDGELGYLFRIGAASLRPFAGVRYAKWEVNESYVTLFGPFDGQFRTQGVGPRIGLDGKVPLTPALALTASISGSWLYGNLNQSGNLPFFFPQPGQSFRRDMNNVEGNIALAYDFAPKWSLAAGYQFDHWNKATLQNFTGGGGGPGDGASNRVTHGPFFRVGYNY